MRFEIHFVFGTDAEIIECEGIDETMKELRLALFGGEHYDEEGNYMMLDVEDWLIVAEPGEIYKQQGGFYIKAKQ